MTTGQQVAGLVLSPTATAISIRIWGGAGRESKPTELSSNAQSALVFMVADLVAANDGVLLTDLRASMSARFETPAKALKAAKQIQGAILEFARHRPDCGSAAAIVIHRETEGEATKGKNSAGAGAPGGSLLPYAKPAQILMTEDAYEKLREMPGLKFRPCAPAGKTGSDAAIRGQELMWRTPESAPRSSQPLAQATQIFAQNGEPPSVKVLPATESLPARHDDLEPPIPVLARHELPREQPIEVRPPVLKWSLAAVGGVVVLAVAIGLMIHYRKSDVVDHASDAPQTLPEQPRVSPESNPPVVSSEPPTSPPPPVATEAPRPKSPKPQTEKPVNTGYFSAKDIPFLLRKADEDAGAGRYDDARREYRIVLQLEPNNAAAKQGLYRLGLAR
jgi:hypothetical protein